MKKINLYLYSIIFLLVILSYKAGFSQESQAKKFENALLWKIENKNTPNVMYVMGTHHLYDKSFLEKETTIQNILLNIDTFVGELHEDSLESISKGATLLKYMLLENTTIKELLSDKQYRKTDKMLKAEAGIALSNLNNMKPMVVAQYIQLAKYAKKTKKDKGITDINEEENNSLIQDSMDMYFQQFAKKNNKKIIGLETAEQQMEALFNNISLDKQIENLMDLVDNKNEGSEQAMQKMDELYTEQNVTELYNFVEKYSNDQEMDALLYKRNKNWFPILTTMLKSTKQHFVAVGAGHLVGKWGILTMFKEAGYSVSPIIIKIK